MKTLAYEMLAQGKSRSTVKNALAPLSKMFHHAIEDGHLTTNPAVRILKRNRGEDGEKQQKRNFLTREEFGVLLHTCHEHFPTDYPFVSLLARTGLWMGKP